MPGIQSKYGAFSSDIEREILDLKQTHYNMETSEGRAMCHNRIRYLASRVAAAMDSCGVLQAMHGTFKHPQFLQINAALADAYEKMHALEHDVDTCLRLLENLQKEIRAFQKLSLESNV